MADLRMLSDVEIEKHGGRSHYGVVHIVDAEAFKTTCLELLEQTFARGIFCPHPVVEFVGEIFRGERCVETAL